MSEKENNLLTVFENRMSELKILSNERKLRIDELEASVREKDAIIQQAKQTISELQTRNTNLLTARRLAEDEKEFQQARKRVDKLVREVDLCINLLINE